MTSSRLPANEIIKSAATTTSDQEKQQLVDAAAPSTQSTPSLNLLDESVVGSGQDDDDFGSSHESNLAVYFGAKLVM